MDNLNQQQHQKSQSIPFENQPYPETFSQSKLSLRKQVGQIITRRRSPTETNHYQQSSDPSISQNKMPTPKGVLSDRNKYRIKNRVKTNNEHYDSVQRSQHKNGGTRMYTQGVQNSLGGMDVKSIVEQSKAERRHARNKSFQEQRQDLQRQLKELLTKKSKLQQLRQNKKKLRAKLNHLEVELKQIKNSSVDDTFDIPEKQRKPRPKIHRLKPIKSVKRTQTYQQHQQELNKLVEESTQQYMKNEIKRAEHEDSDDEQNQVTNYYYQAQLNHKCLNCKHYHTKIQDVRIPVQVKNDFNL